MKLSSKLFSYNNLFQKGQMQIPAGEIFQIAELSVIKSGEITEHVQYCDEITYAISGKALIYSGNQVFEMHAGQVHYLKKGEYHKIVADESQNFHYYCIGFLLNPEYTDIQFFTDSVKELSDFLIEDEGNIKTLFNLLLNEFYIKDEESNLMIHSYLCQILVLLYRIRSGNSKEKLNKINTSTSNHAVYRALKYIDREYIKLTSVKEVSEALSYSEYYLSHVFKEKMDITMKDYLMQKKIITATELLRNSKMSVSEIAEHLNFSSLHSFGQAFKRYTKMSASEFRHISKK